MGPASPHRRHSKGHHEGGTFHVKRIIGWRLLPSGRASRPSFVPLDPTNPFRAPSRAPDPRRAAWREPTWP